MKKFVSYLYNLALWSQYQVYFPPKGCERMYHCKVGEDHLLPSVVQVLKEINSILFEPFSHLS